MFDIHLLLSGFSAIASIEVFPFLVLGSLLGIVVGAIPGLTATMAIALLIPVHVLDEPDLGHRDVAGDLCGRHLCGRDRVDPDPDARDTGGRGNFAGRLSHGPEGRGRARDRHRHDLVRHRRPLLGLCPHPVRTPPRYAGTAFLGARIFRLGRVRPYRDDEPCGQLALAGFHVGAHRPCSRPDRHRPDRRLPPVDVRPSGAQRRLQFRRGDDRPFLLGGGLPADRANGHPSARAARRAQCPAPAWRNSRHVESLPALMHLRPHRRRRPRYRRRDLKLPRLC